MTPVRVEPATDFGTQVPLVIIGAGAAGLCAALAASEQGVEPVLIERDAVPRGSTALSAGLIPAAGTRFQRDKASRTARSCSPPTSCASRTANPIRRWCAQLRKTRARRSSGWPTITAFRSA